MGIMHGAMRLLRRHPWSLACMALASLTAGVYVGVHPASPDLAAQAFRADLFADHGLVLWDGQWYGGHSTPGYSLVAPAVAAVLGLWITGALTIVVSAVLFERLVADRFGTGGRVGALWFAVGVGSSVFSGRLTFALGVAVGLAALLAAQTGRPALGGSLSAVTVLTSPLAGAFLALVSAARAIATRRRGDMVVAAAAVLSGLALTAAFPERGAQPFGEPAIQWILLVTAAGFVAVPREHRALRVGIVLYAVAAMAAYLIDTPVGNNVARLGALFGGPIAACVLWPRPLVLGLLALPLLGWQWARPVIDVQAAANDPSTQRRYYAPLLDALRRQPAMPVGRLEIPITHNHWESTYVAPTVPLARGWERQLDRHVNGVFYRRGLTAASYRAWLDRLGVRWVALPDTRLEGASYPERDLIRAGLPYLVPVWSNRHWRLFAVRRPAPLVRGPARLTAMTIDSFTLQADRPGYVQVSVHWQPYWALTRGRGCVVPNGDWTGVRAHAAGSIRVATAFAIQRIGARSPRCR
jgi:hypothetical protein